MNLKKSKNPRLSVIIPTKNEAGLLPHCLSALANQKTKISYEVLIVDTNSTDGTRRIALSYGARIITEPRKGKVLAFIKGVANAKGEILCFTEADCIAPPHWIQTIVDYFDAHQDAAAIVGEYTFHSSTALLNLLAKTALPLGRLLSHSFFGHHLLRASNFAIRKSVYKKSGGFAANVRELYDIDLARRVAKQNQIHFVADMRSQTSDRRIRGRGLRFLGEFIPAFLATVIFRRPLPRETYQDIR